MPDTAMTATLYHVAGDPAGRDFSVDVDAGKTHGLDLEDAYREAFKQINYALKEMPQALGDYILVLETVDGIRPTLVNIDGDGLHHTGAWT